MASHQTTCWTVIRGAAGGNPTDRQAFAARYGPVVRAYLLARWQGSPLVQEVEDAQQEVFLESFREGGVLERADPAYPGGFRAFLYGVVRNVALRHESRRARRKDVQPPSHVLSDQAGADEQRFSRVFDRQWASTIMREAAARQRELAAGKGDEAARRIELLRLRFQESLPIREIADRWQMDPAKVHREYAKARNEFRQALLEVVAFHHPGSPEEVRAECTQLLALL